MEQHGDEMKRIVFFGHDSGDAAIKRRITALQADGFEVSGIMARRGELRETPWDNIDLGLTRDGDFKQRLSFIFKGARQAAREAEATLRSADLIYARNLDMLMCAFRAKAHLKLETPVVYECLDVHRLLCRNDPIGWTLRGIERALLKRCRGLIVSSPAFLRNYFEKYHAGAYRSVLIENRLVAGQNLPRVNKSALKTDRPLVLGWVGNLRCARSLDLLCGLAAKHSDTLRIHIHGRPAYKEVPDFEDQIAAHENIQFFGAYDAPADLPGIYATLDIVWAGDFMEAGYNSVWLLPNRIYEGGYFATPAIAPAGTETANWILSHAAGFLVEEPLTQTLDQLLSELIADRAMIGEMVDKLVALQDDTFIQPPGFLRSALSDLIRLGSRA